MGLMSFVLLERLTSAIPGRPIMESPAMYRCIGWPLNGLGSGRSSGGFCGLPSLPGLPLLLGSGVGVTTTTADVAGRARIGLAEGDRRELGRPVEEQPVAHAGERVDQGEAEAALGAERQLERGLLHRRRVEQGAEDQRDQHRDQRAGGGAAPAAERQPGAAAPVRRRLLVAGRRPPDVPWCPLVRHQNLK